jgi:hypothetical protein
MRKWIRHLIVLAVAATIGLSGCTKSHSDAWNRGYQMCQTANSAGGTPTDCNTYGANYESAWNQCNQGNIAIGTHDDCNAYAISDQGAGGP